VQLLIFVVFLSKHVKLGNEFCGNTPHNQISSHSFEAQFCGLSFIFCRALTVLVFPSLSDIDEQQNSGHVPTSFTTSNMRTALLWIMTLGVVVISYRHFGTTYWFHPQHSRNLEPWGWNRRVVLKHQ